MDNAIEDFMLGSGLTLKELADKHDVSYCSLQKILTKRIHDKDGIKTNMQSSEITQIEPRKIFPSWKSR